MKSSKLTRSSRYTIRPAIFLLLATALAGSACAQQIPPVDEQSLAGHRVILPAAASGKVAVLILGFTRASKEPTSAWGKRLQTDLGKTSGLEIYSMPVLEEVPGFVRGMVISSMKKGVPEDQRDHFVPVLHHEAEWKKLVSYKAPDDAYLILLDRTGNIAYQASGALNEQRYSQLRRHIEDLLK